MIFWLGVWQFVSHHWCPTSWFYLPCFLNSNWLKFLHECTLGCIVYMWIFLELFVAFPNCLRFSPLSSQMLTLCDTSCHSIWEILILYWMIMKFYMCILDILSFALVLIPSISHLFSFSYDFLKMTHVLLTSWCILENVLTSWF